MANDRLLQADENARSAALDVTRSFIVQAPAGSGKTELLIQRYLRLLSVVDHPEEILAITFTRKAAAEMQLRIMQALRSAAENLRPDAGYEQITFDAARAALLRDGALDWQLLQNPRRLRIQTIDSLNASIARSQPVTTTAGAAGYSIVADSSMRALYREAATATLDQLAESGAFNAATTEVLQHLDTNAWLYVEYLQRMLATRDQWLPFIGSGKLDDDDSARLREQFESGLNRAVCGALEELRDAIPNDGTDELLQFARYAASHLVADGNRDNPIANLDGIESLPATDPAHLTKWQGIAELLLTKQGSFRKTVNKNQGFPAGDDGQKADFLDCVQALAQTTNLSGLLQHVRVLPPVRYSDEQWSVLLALFKLLPLAATELKRLFADHGIADHIEIALSADNAVGTANEPGDIALLLDYQIRHILIDEMQDTSSAQYRMIEALTGGWSDADGRSLFCVGDPMQSIYRFRNAEVGQFLLAQHSGIGDLQLESLTLRRNFRSGEQLVSWFNDVFPSVLAPRDEPQRSAVSYATAIAVPALKGVGNVAVHALTDADTEAEAECGLEVVRDTLSAHPNDDMAILVRGRTHLPALLRRLREAGIPYRAVEIDRLTDLPEVIDVLALTRALVHLGDRHAWLALLRSPWVGLDWRDLHAIVRNDRHSAVWQLIHQAPVLERLSATGQNAVVEFRDRMATTVSAHRTDTLRDRVERSWIELGGPAIVDGDHAVQNVYRFFDVIEANEVAGDLTDIAELESILDTEHVSSHADARLHVMTMHRAKGLQFDHVLLTGLGRVPRAREQRVLSWFDIPDEQGSPQKVISPVGPRTELERDKVHTFINRVEAEKDRNELGRLLYVACTRARKSLHLLGTARQRKSGPQADKRSLLALLWPAVAQEFANNAVDAGDTSSAAEQGEWLVPELRRLQPPWQCPVAQPLPGSAVAAPPDEAVAVEFYWVGAGARLAGTLAHRWIQLSVEGRVDLAKPDYGNLRRVTGRWLNEMGIADRAAEPIITRVETALRGIANDARGRWLIKGEGHAELPLTGTHQSTVSSVVLDRVRIDDDGTHWIVDFKTSSHEGGDLQRFLAAEAKRYRAQLSKYSAIYRNWIDADRTNTTTRCALYFPLLQEFVEVDP